MLKFFRKIRQRLLSEGRVSKYFLYALGEIILVVIGILIALSINNWNEGRKQDRSEQQFIRGVQSDLMADKEYIRHILELGECKRRDFATIKKDILSMYEREPLTLDSLLLKYLSNNRTFYPVVGTFESGISGNQIGKFKHQEFVTATTKLYHSTYTRLLSNAENYDERFYYLVKKYSHFRRTGHLEGFDERQLSELLDDMDYHNRSTAYNMNLLTDALKEIDFLINFEI